MGAHPSPSGQTRVSTAKGQGKGPEVGFLLQEIRELEVEEEWGEVYSRQGDQPTGYAQDGGGTGDRGLPTLKAGQF